MTSRDYDKAYYKKHKKKIAAKSRAWNLKNPQRRKLIKRRWYRKFRKDPRRMKAEGLRRYGIGLQEFFALRKKQKNCCEICRKQFDKTPHVDHSHKTGKVRGLLCLTCNAGLGYFKDSKILLRGAAKYLTRKEKV